MDIKLSALQQARTDSYQLCENKTEILPGLKVNNKHSFILTFKPTTTNTSITLYNRNLLQYKVCTAWILRRQENIKNHNPHLTVTTQIWLTYNTDLTHSYNTHLTHLQHTSYSQLQHTGSHVSQALEGEHLTVLGPQQRGPSFLHLSTGIHVTNIHKNTRTHLECQLWNGSACSVSTGIPKTVQQIYW